MNKFFGFLVGSLFLAQVYGCALLVAGAAGGAGTAVWLSNKLSQDVDVSLERTFQASKKGLKNLKLEIVKETKKDDVAQLISRYYDGQKVWVDLHKMSETSCRIEVRAGVTGDEAAARKILDAILKYL